MRKFRPLVAAGAMILAGMVATPASAGVCDYVDETISSTIDAVSDLVANASDFAKKAGFAAVAHSSGRKILTSVGRGGTGYIAGTLGSIGAWLLSGVSSPYVIAGATVTALGAGGVAGYCYYFTE
ncbi:MAG: hypothetical protein KatS3mg118_2069 [Paracoccaceae bacterium]|nr:MAG: hypothetical protein KatS3mg118_2069 [Paracoccaceae bacterium]